MVPLSERRHRLYENEIPEVVEGLKLRLSQLLEKMEEEDKAEITFRVFYRLTQDEPGRRAHVVFFKRDEGDRDLGRDGSIEED